VSVLDRLKVWLAPSGQDAIRALLDRSLGVEGWVEALPTRAEVGVFVSVQPPKGLPGDLPLLAIGPIARPDETLRTLKHLPEPGPDAFARALKQLAGFGEHRAFESELLEALTEQSSDSIYILDERGYFVFINRRFEQLFGYSRQEVCVPEFNFENLIAPGSQDLIRARGEATARGEVVDSHYEFEAMDASNRHFPVEVSVSKITFRGLPASVGILRDITESRRDKQNLQRTNRELRVLNRVATVVNRAMDLDTVLDLSVEVIAQQPGVDALVATRADEPPGRFTVVAHRGLPEAITTIVGGEGYSYEVPSQSQVVEQSQTFDDLAMEPTEAGLLHPSMADHFGAKLLVPIVHGDRTMGTLQAYNRNSGPFVDETVRLLESVASQLAPALYRSWLHQEQAEQIGHLQALDDLAAQILGVVDRALIDRQIIKAASIISGAERVSLYWQDEAGLVLSPEAESIAIPVEDNALAAAREGNSWLEEDGRLHVPITRGERFSGLLVCHWSRMSLGMASRIEALELLASHASLAVEQQRLHEERDRALRQQFESEKLAGLGALSAGVAHDFNNVLAAILGRTQLLKRQIDQPDWTASLDVIEQAALDGAATVRRIQEFSRQQPDPDARDQVADLDQVVRDTIAQTSAQWVERSGGPVHLDLQLGGAPLVQADERELREVLTNLVNNALDAMALGGTLGLHTGEVDGESYLVCADDGAGMPPSVRERIFDPFYTTKGKAGTGLGLAVSFSIIQRCGGRMTVASEPGQGTQFTLFLPQQSEDVSLRVEAQESLAPQAVGNQTILVTEDNDDVRDLLVQILQDGGYRTLEARHGLECLEVLTHTRPDLVLSDLGMPELDGWGLAERLKTEHADLPFGFITGWGDSIDRDAVDKAGARLVLSKPFRIEDVLKQVARAITG